MLAPALGVFEYRSVLTAGSQTIYEWEYEMSIITKTIHNDTLRHKNHTLGRFGALKLGRQLVGQMQKDQLYCT